MQFYDWEACRFIQEIDLASDVASVYWSEAGDLCCLACEDTFYLLRYNAEAVAAYFEAGGEPTEEGIESAFELEYEINERVQTGMFVGDCFVYTNHSTSSAYRLNYVVGGKVTTLHHLDRPMFLLGFLAKENRLFLIDKECGIVSFGLQTSVLEYQTAIVRGLEDAADAVLPTIPVESLQMVAKFLESQGRKELALELATDVDYKFELAIQLSRLDVAYEIAAKKHADGIDVTSKWRQLADLALAACKIELAEECMVNAGDLAGLLLLYSSMGEQHRHAPTHAQVARCTAIRGD